MVSVDTADVTDLSLRTMFPAAALSGRAERDPLYRAALPSNFAVEAFPPLEAWSYTSRTAAHANVAQDRTSTLGGLFGPVAITAPQLPDALVRQISSARRRGHHRQAAVPGRRCSSGCVVVLSDRCRPAWWRRSLMLEVQPRPDGQLILFSGDRGLWSDLRTSHEPPPQRATEVTWTTGLATTWSSPFRFWICRPGSRGHQGLKRVAALARRVTLVEGEPPGDRSYRHQDRG